MCIEEKAKGLYIQCYVKQLSLGGNFHRRFLPSLLCSPQQILYNKYYVCNWLWSSFKHFKPNEQQTKTYDDLELSTDRGARMFYSATIKSWYIPGL